MGMRITQDGVQRLRRDFNSNNVSAIDTATETCARSGRSAPVESRDKPRWSPTTTSQTWSNIGVNDRHAIETATKTPGCGDDRERELPLGHREHPDGTPPIHRFT